MPNPNPNKSHPGRAGRKPAPFPSFVKKLRATQAEREELAKLLTGDARRDFIDILTALSFWRASRK